MNRIRLYSAIITLALYCLIALWLAFGHIDLRRTDHEWPPKRESEITVEEFAEIIDLPQSAAPAADNPAPAPLPEEMHGAATPTPESGHDLDNHGEPAEAPATVTSKQTSPVKVKDKKP